MSNPQNDMGEPIDIQTSPSCQNNCHKLCDQNFGCQTPNSPEGCFKCSNVAKTLDLPDGRIECVKSCETSEFQSKIFDAIDDNQSICCLNYGNKNGTKICSREICSDDENLNKSGYCKKKSLIYYFGIIEWMFEI